MVILSNDDNDAVVCKKIDSIMDEFEERIEKETGCTVEGTAVLFKVRPDDDTAIAIHTGPYENINVMEGKPEFLNVDYPKR
ncbi:hypothetical protein [Methanococcus maripaludis]|uniref:hypothetical protein n=1 Tax=Methanococcus maripaludis TaxID=39152 RepID=UPI001F3D436C|nr:hypothetical protein [Methanococcus maripaludis]